MERQETGIVAVETKAIANASQQELAQIKTHLMPGANDSELKYFMQVCKHTGLDPWSRQIYSIKRRSWDKSINGYRETWMPQTSIDGFRAVADNAGNYAGSDEPIFEMGADGLPIKATVTVYKMVQGQRCAFTASARWSEYCPDEKQDKMWRKMPFTMLSKCAEALALRKGWSTKLSGLYTKDEMQQAHQEGDKTTITATIVETENDYPQKTTDADTNIDEIAKTFGASVINDKPQKPAPIVDYEIKEKIEDLLKQCAGDRQESQENLLEKITTFTGRDGKVIKGIRDIKKINYQVREGKKASQAQVIYSALKDEAGKLATEDVAF